MKRMQPVILLLAAMTLFILQTFLSAKQHTGNYPCPDCTNAGLDRLRHE